MKNQTKSLFAVALLISGLALQVSPGANAASMKTGQIQTLSCSKGFHQAQDNLLSEAKGNPSVSATISAIWCTDGKTVASKPAPYVYFQGTCSGTAVSAIGCSWKSTSEIGVWDPKLKAFIVSLQTTMKLKTGFTIGPWGEWAIPWGQDQYLIKLGLSPSGYFVYANNGSKMPDKIVTK